MRIDEDHDRQAVQEAGDGRLLPVPTPPRRVDTTPEEEDQEALITRAGPYDRRADPADSGIGGTP